MSVVADSHWIKVLKLGSEQGEGRDSFVGGHPRLPPGEGLPTCRVCGALLTFFFQVAFPEGRRWAGRTLAVFECTACRDDAHPTPFVDQTLIPSMERMNLVKGEDVPDGALDLVQRTFRFLVFDTAAGVVRRDYAERVAYRPITLHPQTDAKLATKSKVGGAPGWIQVDSTPGRYLGEPLGFLVQWKYDFEFDRVAGSPAPFNAYADSLPDLTEKIPYYRLFQGTQLYFFGNHAGGRPHVYMIPSVP